MPRYIDADALKRKAQKEATEAWKMNIKAHVETILNQFVDWIDDAPTADVVERKKGKWTEKHHAYSDEEQPIEEWQSCRCSECGKYDTRPYLYYFREPRFCSWCGAEMEQ